MKLKKTKKSSLLEFLKGCPKNMDIIYFENPNDAYNYGNKVRENIELEDLDEEVIVDISGNVVRIKIVAEEPACVGLGCE
jgi:uncharacterized protein YuzE